MTVKTRDVNTQEFLKTLNNVSRASSSSSTMAYYQYLKLTVVDNGVLLLASNGQFTIESLIPNIQKDKQIVFDKDFGSTLVNSKLINAIVAKLPSDTFTFEIIENGLAKIEANNIVYNLNVVDSSEYPQIDLSAIGIKLILSSKDINDAISQVSFAASQKNTRPQLMAVNTESTSSSIIFTATDGARLARKEIAIDTNGVFSVNIPSKTFIEIARTLDDTKEVEVYVSDKKVLFKTDFTTISTSLIEGDYPNVKNIIPKNFYYYLEVNAEEFLNALSRVSLLSIERENVVKMTMEEGRAIISSKSQQVGSAQEFLNLFRYTGERLEISFNGDYVASAVRALNSNDVLLSFLGEMKPFTITDKNNSNVIQLITPVRTY